MQFSALNRLIDSRLFLLSMLLLGAALRLVGINNESPPGLAHDEVANWLINRSILDGNHAIYFTRAYGHEAGFHYIQTAFITLLGDNTLAMRLPAAFAGLIGVAVCYRLTRQLFGKKTAVFALALCATLFWPIFYSRLALRAILVPVTAGLSAYFWLQGWDRYGKKAPLRLAHHHFILSGLFAGLSLNIYLAARALPIFYALWLGYLAVTDWQAVQQRWRGILWFWLLFTLTAAPLFLFLQNNPGAEFRVEEVSFPLVQLQAGNFQPIIENGWRILGMFGVQGDPLWRQNVAFTPVFEPLVGVLFYLGLLAALWRWRHPAFAFLILWTAVSMLPSLVTINAPSTIRMIMVLPLLTAVPALIFNPKRLATPLRNMAKKGRLIHTFPKLSTVLPKLSTVGFQFRGLLLLTIVAINAVRSATLLFVIWPQGGDIPFVWQSGFRDIAATIQTQPDDIPTSIAGWSPDTMDVPTMALLFNNQPPPLSHFNPQDGTLILPTAQVGTTAALYTPTILDFPLPLRQQLDFYEPIVESVNQATRFTIVGRERPLPYPTAVQFGNQMRLVGIDVTADNLLVTHWTADTAPSQPMRLFGQALNEEGNVLAEDYHWDNEDPQGLWFPHWQAGAYLIQLHDFMLTSEMETLRLGIFDPYSCSPGSCQNLLTAVGEPFFEFTLP